MVVIAPFAAAVAAMKVGKAVSNALGTKPTPTPDVPMNRKEPPNRDKYNKEKPKTIKEQVDKSGQRYGSVNDAISPPQQRTEESVDTDANGMVSTGKRQPIKGTGMSMTYDEYKRNKGIGAGGTNYA